MLSKQILLSTKTITCEGWRGRPNREMRGGGGMKDEGIVRINHMLYLSANTISNRIKFR
jgi:hypothetical protein